MKNTMRRLLFPQRCPCCGELHDMDRSGLCASCAGRVKPVGDVTCLCCGKPLADRTESYCTDCKRRGGHVFIQNRSAAVYAGPVRESMYSLKYKGSKWIADFWGEQLIDMYYDWIMDMGFDLMVPIPTHSSRKLKRGYNQAEVLAYAIEENLRKKGTGKTPKVRNLVVREKSTEAQKELGAKLRQKNLKKAFKLSQSVVELKRLYHDGVTAFFSRVLLVDDILTTGATLDAVSELLLSEKIAEEVYAMTVAVGCDLGDI